ncbi:MAG: hypothetical protein NDJ65_05460 [Paludibacteraceae bacterium]|nr:hypothetical protein [Paludibacteraceae bacterium]
MDWLAISNVFATQTPQQTPASQPQAQVAETVQQPVVSRPAPAVVKRAPGKPSNSSTALPHGISIYGTSKQAEEEEAAKAQSKKNRNYRFDESSLRMAWFAYSDKIPEKLVLSQTMKCASTLSITAENEITVTVSNSYQQNDLQNEMQEILAFMSDELRNDNIKMKIVVDENITTGLNKTDAEMFHEMKENNEILKFLSEELDLEI